MCGSGVVVTQEEIDEDDEKWYCWEEAEWVENKLMYEYYLEHLEELPQKERM